MPPATPEPSTVLQSLKRTVSDAEFAPQDTKKARRNSSPEPSTRRDSNRDAKRRRRKRKKAPVVTPPTKNEATQSRPGERSRAPLSARNETIRFASAEAEQPASVVPPAKHPSQVSSPKMLSQGLKGPSLNSPTEHQSQGMLYTANDKERTVSPVGPPPERSSSSLEEKIAQLQAKLKLKNDLIASHQALLNQVQQAVTCQVCLDMMYKPYVLTPCGHLACHSCLVNWFTVPPPDNRPVPPAIRRRKTCPHCRAVVRERPVEVWGVKGIAQAMGKSELLPNQLPVLVEPAESLDANTDPWKDIFPKPGAASQRGFPWFIPGADIDDDDVHTDNVAPRGEDVGMLDMEDGGIYRCLDCMHEIWDTICSNCGRVYPGHRHEEDEDDEENPVGWLEDQMFAEEVDVADDPGWMGLEDGEADDGHDFDDRPPFPPWRRRFHAFGGPWGFLGTIDVDEEEDEDDMYSGVDELRVPDEDEGSEDEGYESSFIDDNDGGAIVDFEDSPRIHEISDDESYHSHRRPHIVDLGSDERDEQGGLSDVPERRWVRRGGDLFSSDGEAEDVSRQASLRRRPRFVGSDADGSDGHQSER